ncbi:Fe(3+)-hydroxamate ABC transporter permease FhuB [Vibrio amylolyticus]|uniref:Fe(3+)-hydroxamate ABC transporter permease FhuB n=1 Tax=Vibrio amylolyticus TaxID=2847292 RepID=UPI0035521F26
MLKTYSLSLFLLVSIVALSLGHLGWATELSIFEQLNLLGSLSLNFDDYDDFESIVFTQSALPRFVMALMVGGVLGLVGSVLQQLTQNHLVSPLTLGTSAGAWLAIVIGSVWFPLLMAEYSLFVALSGSMLTFGLVIAIVGLKNLSGLPIILAGMATNILMGSIATAIILLHDQYARNLFVWGAGDLGQNGWENVLWLAPKLIPAFFLVVFAPRILALLRIGQSAAKARGLSIVPVFVLILAVSLWLVSASISAVGVISFIGLLAPNIARAVGARTPQSELVTSTLLGAALLIATDWFAMFIGNFTLDMIPSGTTAALIGAPALIFFTRRKLKAQDQVSITLPKTSAVFTSRQYLKLIGLLLMSLLVAFVVTRSTTDGAAEWVIRFPDTFAMGLLWPRMLTAICVGAGLAAAGVLLQRLIYNPLASPDILGLSAGATLVLVAASIFVGVNIFESAPQLAFFGSMSVLVLLLVLGRKNHYAPSMLILTGISLTALIDALVQFTLAKGNENSFTILAWLAGSTYRVTPSMAVSLLIAMLMMCGLALATHRWLTMLSAGRMFAKARGVNVPMAFITLFVLVALICAATTAAMGPVGFLGLLAPHMAIMLGAKRAKEQLIVAMLLGATLLLVANWLGQTIRYPSEIAAGTIVSVIGGSYFLLLLLKGRKTKSVV